METTITLKELHPNNTKGNGDKVGEKIKESRRYFWYKFKHNGQIIKKKIGH